MLAPSRLHHRLLELKPAKRNPRPPASRAQDVGGQDKIRPLWRHYYTGTQGLVFVVDSQDRARIDEAREELHKILNDREMRDCFLLVFANKQDMPNGQSVSARLDDAGQITRPPKRARVRVVRARADPFRRPVFLLFLLRDFPRPPFSDPGQR